MLTTGNHPTCPQDFVARINTSDGTIAGSGRVAITYDFDFGPRVSIVDLANVPAFGDLQWSAGTVYTAEVA